MSTCPLWTSQVPSAGGGHRERERESLEVWPVSSEAPATGSGNPAKRGGQCPGRRPWGSRGGIPPWVTDSPQVTSLTWSGAPFSQGQGLGVRSGTAPVCLRKMKGHPLVPAGLPSIGRLREARRGDNPTSVPSHPAPPSPICSLTSSLRSQLWSPFVPAREQHQVNKPSARAWELRCARRRSADPRPRPAGEGRVSPRGCQRAPRRAGRRDAASSKG